MRHGAVKMYDDLLTKPGENMVELIGQVLFGAFMDREVEDNIKAKRNKANIHSSRANKRSTKDLSHSQNENQ